MKLSTWITKSGGTVAVGKLLGVTHNRVHAWLTGKSLPRPALMLEIVKLSKGVVTFDSMVAEEKKRKASKKSTCKR